MSDITLSSKEYCESVFVDGPKFDKLSAFVSGPDAQVQGKLTAGTGINLNNNIISVNTATSVGTSNLPVAASAVNTKLNGYVNSVSSPDGSITVSKSGSSVTLKANGGGGNYVPLGSYGSSQQYGALPIGSNSTASGDYSTASGYNSTASGSNSTASGSNSTASGDLAQTFGACGRNANDCCTVIAAIKGVGSDCGAEIEYVTQLYLIPKGSPLAVQYEDGEACLGYVTVDSSWNKIASGTKKLSELLNNNVNTFAPKLTVE